MKIVIATSNLGKVAELQVILAPLNWTLFPLSNFGRMAIVESGSTFEENALLKARFACKHTGIPAIADDSGLEVDYLCGRPGVWSARYSDSGLDKDNNLKLLGELNGVPFEQRTARFRCVIAFVKKYNERNPVVCSASWEGVILEKPSGNNGFGYDPLFFVLTDSCTAAELKTERKNLISHRAKACDELVRTLKENS